MHNNFIISIIITTLFIGTCIIPSIAIDNSNNFSPSGNILYVGGTGDGNYTKIEYAIENSSDGDAVFVYNGYYKEGNLRNKKKSIKLIGEDKYNTIIDGEGHGEVFFITDSNTSVSNFSVKNGCFYLSFDAQIEIYQGNNITISNNIIERGVEGGICLSSSNNCKILNNIIRFNSEYGLFIHSWIGKSSNNIISGNHFIRNKNGVKLEGFETYFNLITKNNFIFNKYSQALFENSLINIWINNYWNRPRLLPKPIIGTFDFPISSYPYWDIIPIPLLKFDWWPARMPFKI